MGDKENPQGEENLSKEVDELLEQGLTQKEIETRGYSPSLVRQRVRKRVKAGKGPPRPSREGGPVAVRKTGESVLPEWLERDVAEIFDGEVRDQRIFMAGMSVPLMGLRLFAEGVRPIIDLLSIWQRGQAEAARASQGDVIQVAKTAGEAGAMGVARYFEETKPWVAASPNPLMAMMVSSMQPFFSQAMSGLMGGLMRPGAQGQLGGQQPPGTKLPLPAEVTEMSSEEQKEVFGE